MAGCWTSARALAWRPACRAIPSCCSAGPMPTCIGTSGAPACPALWGVRCPQHHEYAGELLPVTGGQGGEEALALSAALGPDLLRHRASRGRQLDERRPAVRGVGEPLGQAALLQPVD